MFRMFVMHIKVGIKEHLYSCQTSKYSKNRKISKDLLAVIVVLTIFWGKSPRKNRSRNRETFCPGQQLFFFFMLS